MPGIPLWEMKGCHAAAASGEPNAIGSVGNAAIETGRFLAPAASVVPPEIAIALDAQASQPNALKGVNLPQLSFGENAIPGKLGTSYQIPSGKSVAYYTGRA